MKKYRVLLDIVVEATDSYDAKEQARLSLIEDSRYDFQQTLDWFCIKPIRCNYKGFRKHIESYDSLGIPYGLSDLRRLAIHFNTPIPKCIKNKDGGMEINWEDKIPY